MFVGLGGSKDLDCGSLFGRVHLLHVFTFIFPNALLLEQKAEDAGLFAARLPSAALYELLQVVSRIFAGQI